MPPGRLFNGMPPWARWSSISLIMSVIILIGGTLTAADVIEPWLFATRGYSRAYAENLQQMAIEQRVRALTAARNETTEQYRQLRIAQFFDRSTTMSFQLSVLHTNRINLNAVLERQPGAPAILSAIADIDASISRIEADLARTRCDLAKMQGLASTC